MSVLTQLCSTLHSQSPSNDYNCCDSLLAICLVLILTRHKPCALPTQRTGSSVHEVTSFYLNWFKIGKILDSMNNLGVKINVIKLSN